MGLFTRATTPDVAASAEDRWEHARQEEVAYQRLVADWQPTKKAGAGATPGRASRGPSVWPAARRASKPQEPAL